MLLWRERLGTRLRGEETLVMARVGSRTGAHISVFKIYLYLATRQHPRATCGRCFANTSQSETSKRAYTLCILLRRWISSPHTVVLGAFAALSSWSLGLIIASQSIGAWEMNLALNPDFSSRRAEADAANSTCSNLIASRPFLPRFPGIFRLYPAIRAIQATRVEQATHQERPAPP